MIRSPGGPLCVPRPPWPLSRILVPLSTPEGTVNYVFDPATGFHTRTYTVNSDVSYAPDALGRLKTVTVTKQNGVSLTPSLVTTYSFEKAREHPHDKGPDLNH